jgi:hypothetical protein
MIRAMIPPPRMIKILEFRLVNEYNFIRASLFNVSATWLRSMFSLFFRHSIHGHILLLFKRLPKIGVKPTPRRLYPCIFSLIAAE